MTDDAEKSATTALPQKNEAEALMHEVRRLLVHSEKALEQECVKEQAETLERWLESYRRGLSAAQKLSENSSEFLLDMRERLRLALEEMQRLEDEGGGTPATPEQKRRMEDLSRAIGRIDHLVSSIGGASFKVEEHEVA